MSGDITALNFKEKRRKVRWPKTSYTCPVLRPSPYAFAKEAALAPSYMMQKALHSFRNLFFSSNIEVATSQGRTFFHGNFGCFNILIVKNLFQNKMAGTGRFSDNLD